MTDDRGRFFNMDARIPLFLNQSISTTDGEISIEAGRHEVTVTISTSHGPRVAAGLSRETAHQLAKALDGALGFLATAAYARDDR